MSIIIYSLDLRSSISRKNTIKMSQCSNTISGMYCDAQNHGFSGSNQDVSQVIAHCRALLDDPNKRLTDNMNCTGIEIFFLVYDSKLIIDYKDRTKAKTFRTLSEFDAFLNTNNIPLPTFVSCY